MAALTDPGPRFPLPCPFAFPAGPQQPCQRWGAELHCADLLLLQELDREHQPAYMLELVAKDGSMATVYIPICDTGDNSPAVAQSSVRVEVPEDGLPSSLLLNLDAANPKKSPNDEAAECPND